MTRPPIAWIAQLLHNEQHTLFRSGPYSSTLLSLMPSAWATLPPAPSTSRAWHSVPRGAQAPAGAHAAAPSALAGAASSRSTPCLAAPLSWVQAPPFVPRGVGSGASAALTAPCPGVPAGGAAGRGSSRTRHARRLMCVQAASPATPPEAPELLSRPQIKREVQIQDVPLNSAAKVLNKYLAPGRLLEAREDDAFFTAVVKGAHEPPPGHAADVKYQVVDQDGNVRFIRASQVVVVMPGVNYEDSAAREFADMAAAADRGIVAELWKQMTLEHKANGTAPGDTFLDILALCKAMHGNTRAASLYLTHRLLMEDRTFFHRLKTRPPTFRLRDESEVLRNKAAQSNEAAREAKRAETRTALTAAAAAAHADKPTQAEWLAGPHSETLTHVKNFAVGVDAVPHGSAAFAMLDLSLTVAPEGAAELLKLIGFWHRHMPVAWLKLDMPLDFPRFVEAHAERVAANPPPDDLAALRQDLSSHTVLAIDDERTTEVDDAVSVQPLEGGGWRVWVHVSQPCAYVSLGDPLDLEARRRGRTLYLPWTRVMMFPPVLSEGRFALSGAEARKALSFVADVDATGRLTSYDVVPSTVVPTGVAYADADRLLSGQQGESDLSAEGLDALRQLDACAKARNEHRRLNGSSDIPNIECDLQVADLDADEPTVTVGTITMLDSPSRLLVMEMMVLAGEVAAKYAHDRGTPMPFRNQPQAMAPPGGALERIPSIYARGYAVRRGMSKGGLTTDRPLKHSGLGLDAYAQVTSPIRRYNDLLAHYQLKATLLGKTPPHSCATLQIACERGQDVLRDYQRLEAECRNHFLAYYFRANPRAAYEGEYLGITGKSPPLAQVLVKPLGLEIRVAVPQGMHPSPGSRCSLKVRNGNVNSGSWTWEIVG